MADAQVQQILEGLKIGQARRTQQFELAQRAADRAQQAQYQQQLIDNEKNRLAEEIRQHDITNKAAQAMYRLQNLAEENKITQTLQQGMPVSGDTLISKRVDPSGQTWETHSIKDAEGNEVVPPFEMLSHADWLKQETANQAAIQAPALAARQAELAQQAQQAQDLEKIREQFESGQQQRTLDYNRERDKANQQAENLRANLQRSTQLKIAELEHGNLADFDPTPFVSGAMNGTISQGDISKLQPNQKRVVSDLLSQVGVVPLTDKQKQFVQGVGGGVATIKNMDQYIQNLNNNPTSARIGVGSAPYALERQLRQQVNEGLVQATGTMQNGSTRLSQPRIAQMSSAYGMSQSPTANNQQMRDQFAHTLNEMMDTELYSASPAQRESIKKQIGLSPILDSIPAPAQAQPTVQSPGQQQIPQTQTPSIIRYDANGQRIGQ